ncbi:MAG: ATP-dependent DNA helicase RecG [bacterium]|nr:ATP-dependent DNA helicase RecG [bacterium]
MDADASIETLVRLTHTQRAALKRLRIETVRDLLYHFPARYESAADIRRVSDVRPGETAVFYGMFSKLEMKKSFRTKVPMAEGSFSDGSGTLKVFWFHQPYLAKMIPTNELVRLRGKVSERSGRKYVANPLVEKAYALPEIDSNEGVIPVYPETAGITSLWFYHAVKRAMELGIVQKMDDPIPETILKSYHLPSLGSALIWIHEPEDEKDAEVARKRFAFEEVFLIQIARAREREKNREKRAYTVDADEKRVAEFMKLFPFTPTEGQKKATADILADFLEPYPMARLLEGDVGSGKTAVAAATAYAVVTSRPPHSGRTNSRTSDVRLLTDVPFGNLQVAYMCPTEILAKQHFATFTSFFRKHPIQIGLITSSGCYKFPSKVNPREATDISRAQFLKWVANGEIPIVIGTHSLIQKTLAVKHLAYVIIDEQHRFGTFQRQAIATKGAAAPHLLSMTATPIPRTLALTVYGDLDLTILDELPAGRKPVKTEIVTASRRDAAYEKMRTLLKEGRQAYVICPRIDEPDPTKQLALQARSVAAELKHLQAKVFPEYKIEKLHSKMTPNDKEETMARFAKGETQILVATSVVEVGVNVENATVIMIEGAERFGLAQLHQLRGRVQRSTYQPYCFLMVDKGSGDTARLKAIVSAKNGFELAEKDLEIRGAGELYGRKQWGISDIGMDALKNLKLVEAARGEAGKLVEKDPELSKHPLLKKLSEEKVKELHFE